MYMGNAIGLSLLLPRFEPEKAPKALVLAQTLCISTRYNHVLLKNRRYEPQNLALASLNVLSS